VEKHRQGGGGGKECIMKYRGANPGRGAPNPVRGVRNPGRGAPMRIEECAPKGGALKRGSVGKECRI